MEIRTQNTDRHEKYDNFKAHQKIIKGLIKGDLAVLTINGEEVFRCKVLYGKSAHVNIVLQDKGDKQTPLTDEEIQQAIFDFRAKQ